jgi:hypothetical protein
MVLTRRMKLTLSQLENCLSEMSAVTNEITKNVLAFLNLDDLDSPPPEASAPAPIPEKTDANTIREFCKVGYPPLKNRSFCALPNRFFFLVIVSSRSD